MRREPRFVPARYRRVPGCRKARCRDPAPARATPDHPGRRRSLVERSPDERATRGAPAFAQTPEERPRSTPPAPTQSATNASRDLSRWACSSLPTKCVTAFSPSILLRVDLRTLQLAAEVHVHRLPFREHVERRRPRLAVAVPGILRAA